LYIAPDADDREVERSLARIKRQMWHVGVKDPKALGEERFYPFCKSRGAHSLLREFKLTDPGRENIIALIQKIRTHSGQEEPESVIPFVVLDTLTRMAPGGICEIDNVALTDLVDQTDEIALMTNSVVLVLTHVAKQDHYKDFDLIDPATYARGGTATAAAARVVMAMARVGKTNGEVIGVHRIANNQPLRGPLYYRVIESGSTRRGVNFWQPLPEEEVAKVQAQNAPAKASWPIESVVRGLAKLWPQQPFNPGPNKGQFTTMVANVIGGSDGTTSVKNKANEAWSYMVIKGLATETNGPNNSKILIWKPQPDDVADTAAGAGDEGRGKGTD